MELPPYHVHQKFNVQVVVSFALCWNLYGIYNIR